MDLTECRRQIDEIDRELTQLLEQRLHLVAQVACYKKAQHMEIFDPRREAAVLKRIAALANNGELAPYLQNIYRCIMAESKNYEAEKMEDIWVTK
ncbi:chorismate mutase [Megasphaera lornae]|uniref:Chorismate mutase n=1 Tax=Megasphaera lornae TaxID=1000568 RepID=D3LWG3_9FIRM|nr:MULTISPECIES: chorismate mutase [Megasphaera]EFD93475.1 chorismate mutase [Megasphaera genomosp. type_1 str. 28L]EGL41367.1 chorismate mutase [Megasphaera lornae]KXB91299.1 chorismate mutase [Veillonellaceae bacterium DNF00751]MUP49470.1 chorismate mutase [Veillonellaceae bacterium M1-70]